MTQTFETKPPKTAARRYAGLLNGQTLYPLMNGGAWEVDMVAAYTCKDAEASRFLVTTHGLQLTKWVIRKLAEALDETLVDLETLKAVKVKIIAAMNDRFGHVGSGYIFTGLTFEINAAKEKDIDPKVFDVLDGPADQHRTAETTPQKVWLN